MKGMKENALQCKHTGGVPPLGYDLDADKRLIINPREAEAVKLIFDLYHNGYGYSYILDSLFERGFKTKNGKDFQKNSLYGILTNPKYQFCVVPAKTKAQAVKRTLNGDISEECPATILRKCDGATLYLDSDSSELL